MRTTGLSAIRPRLLLLLGVFAFTAGPILPTDLGSPAFARGGGGGGGGGGGAGGGGGGAGGGQGGGGSASSGGHGQGQGQGQGQGRGGGAASAGLGRGGAAAQGRGAESDRGTLASALGALNAAHASPTARLNAAPNSRVGMIATYEAAMLVALAMPLGPDRTSAIEAARANDLAAAANKPLSSVVVARVDELLGLPPTD